MHNLLWNDIFAAVAVLAAFKPSCEFVITNLISLEKKHQKI